MRTTFLGHVIAAYDAAGVVISAIGSVKRVLRANVSAATVYTVLRRMNGPSAYQGVGGRLSFDSTGEPRDKLVVIDKVVDRRHVQFETYVGAL